VNFPILLFGTAAGWNFSLLLRILVALGGAFLWLRELGRSRFAATLGAVGFSLSGPFIAWLEHTHSATAAPIPLLLYFISRLSREPTGKNIAGIAFSTWFILVGGHPETALLAAMIALGLVCVRFPTAGKGARAVGAAILGAGLASPFLFPFLEYYSLSEARLGIARHGFTLPARDLLRFLDPKLAGSNPIEGAATVSIAVLLLVPFGLARIRTDRDSKFWCGVIFVTALVA